MTLRFECTTAPFACEFPAGAHAVSLENMAHDTSTITYLRTGDRANAKVDMRPKQVASSCDPFVANLVGFSAQHPFRVSVHYAAGTFHARHLSAPDDVT